MAEGAQPDAQRSITLRWIARTGWILGALWAVTLLLWGVVEPEPYAQGWRLVLELAFLGRLVNVADGIATGFGTPYLLVQSGLQDIVLLLVAYPPIVALCEGAAARRSFIGQRLELVRATAERHTARVERLGALGLWIFVFFPFWSTGALVGGVVGYLLGMRTWVTFTSVIAGHTLSTLSLIFFFDAVADAAQSFDTGLVRFLPWIVLALLLAGGLARKRLQRS